MPKMMDLTGKQFGRLTVIGIDKEHAVTPRKWECVCVCGKTTSVYQNHLTSNHTKSCGCLVNDVHATHLCTVGGKPNKTYKTWQSMKDRCRKENSHSKYYYDKGVVVCTEWLDFETFLNDMGPRPIGKTIDRIDPNGDYCKDNCRWASPKTQARNLRTARKLTVWGKTMQLDSFAESTEQNRETIWNRHLRGWTDYEAVFGRNNPSPIDIMEI